MDWGNLFFSYQGRINRAKYWLGILVINGAAQIVLALSGGARALDTLNVVVALVATVLVCFLAIKRLHDRDKSGWWLLLFTVAPTILLGIGAAALTSEATVAPAVAFSCFFVAGALMIWAFVELGCRRGTAGPNRYGPDPLAPQLAATGSTGSALPTATA